VVVSVGVKDNDMSDLDPLTNCIMWVAVASLIAGLIVGLSVWWFYYKEETMSTITSNLVKDFTADEQYLVGQADAGVDGSYKQITVITDIYVARMKREAARLALHSSKEIAAASERQAKSLTRATWFLAGATISLFFATAVMAWATIDFPNRTSTTRLATKSIRRPAI
jgi:hypothetical protein